MEKMLTNSADYVGKQGALHVRQRLIPLSIAGRRSARAGDNVALPDGERVGVVTSGSFAPSLGYAIALAWVDAAHADADSFIIRAAKTELSAQKSSLPFYTRGTVRMKLL
jgi:aminomethyltransferase